MELGTGVGVGVGDGFTVGVGEGDAAGVGVGAGAGEEAPTLPQPEIIRMAAAETTTAGTLKRQMNANKELTLGVKLGAVFLGIDDLAYP